MLKHSCTSYNNCTETEIDIDFGGEVLVFHWNSIFIGYFLLDPVHNFTTVSDVFTKRRRRRSRRRGRRRRRKRGRRGRIRRRPHCSQATLFHPIVLARQVSHNSQWWIKSQTHMWIYMHARTNTSTHKNTNINIRKHTWMHWRHWFKVTDFSQSLPLYHSDVKNLQIQNQISTLPKNFHFCTNEPIGECRLAIKVGQEQWKCKTLLLPSHSDSLMSWIKNRS